jgi:bacteriorhodopsin
MEANITGLLYPALDIFLMSGYSFFMQTMVALRLRQITGSRLTAHGSRLTKLWSDLSFLSSPPSRRASFNGIFVPFRGGAL